MCSVVMQYVNLGIHVRAENGVKFGEVLLLKNTVERRLKSDPEDDQVI